VDRGHFTDNRANVRNLYVSIWLLFYRLCGFPSTCWPPLRAVHQAVEADNLMKINFQRIAKMTIVAFHYTENSILAVTDGLISRGKTRVMEESVKIWQFEPQYKIPKASLGHLNRFSEYRGGIFCLAYAGNYTIISSVIAELNAIMSRRLVLRRKEEGGTPCIYEMRDEGQSLRGHSYSDDFNFHDSELIDLSLNLIMNIVERVVKKVCVDFTRNSLSQPDIELIVFGQELIKFEEINRAQFISCKKCEFDIAETTRFSILPWRAFFFGEQKSSDALREQFDDSDIFDQSILMDNYQSKNESWLLQPEAVPLNERKRIKAIKEAVFKLIAAGTGSIGGNCNIAESIWSQPLRITSISHEAVLKAVGG